MFWNIAHEHMKYVMIYLVDKLILDLLRNKNKKILHIDMYLIFKAIHFE